MIRHDIHRLLLLGGIALAAAQIVAQTPASSGPLMSFTATTDGVAGAPDSIRIDVLRWSTDAERDQLMSAWNMTGSGRGARGGAAGRGAGGRGAAGRGGRGGRAAAAADDPAPDPDAVQDPFGTFGLRGRGGRSGGDDGPPPPTPEGTLATALKQAATVGYLWSSEVAGYALRFAGKAPGPEGADRIVLITDRRLGKTNDRWTPIAPGPPSTYDFSVIELRVNPKGEGEGKISLTGKVVPDGAAKIVALENYAGQPVVLKNLKRRSVDRNGNK
jgi:hypothetical protein